MKPFAKRFGCLEPSLRAMRRSMVFAGARRNPADRKPTSEGPGGTPDPAGGDAPPYPKPSTNSRVPPRREMRIQEDLPRFPKHLQPIRRLVARRQVEQHQLLHLRLF